MTIERQMRLESARYRLPESATLVEASEEQRRTVLSGFESIDRDDRF